MKTVERQRLLVKVARLYYEQELTQSQVSERLRLSRQKVQRLLREARERDVVRISVRPVMNVYEQLEQALEQLFGLREAIVVETSAYQDQPTVMREIGVGAADYLARVLRPGDVLVMSWGGSLLGMIEALQAGNSAGLAASVTIVQGLGGLGDPTHETHAADLTRRLAQILGGQAILLPAPGVAGSLAAAEAYNGDPFVAAALERGATANLAFMGIGAPRRDSILMRQGTIVQWPELLDLQQGGAVGDINLRYFDGQGQLIPSKLNDRVVGLTLNQIRCVDTVVGVAGGEAKLKAIQGAVQGKLIDVLVTDHKTAEMLVEESL